jgi:predicted nucleotidyltransferase
LLEQRPDVLEVRLFGSLVTGAARPGSDADLFIVVRDGAPPFLDRIAELAPYFTGVGIGCDVIAYTESECQVLAERHDAFARAVLDEGIPLAQRDVASAGRATLTAPPRT